MMSGFNFKTKVLKGKITKIIYQTQKSDYVVLQFKTENDKKITAVGNMSSPKKEYTYELKGKFIRDQKYGIQFKFEKYRSSMPDNREGLIKYLKSVMTKVGDVRANKIIDELGTDALEKIKKDPDLLKQFDFISDLQLQEIKKELFSDEYRAKFISSICNLGFSTNKANSIWKHYLKKGMTPEKILKDLLDNPYQLIDEIDNVGFTKADRIALSLNDDKKSIFRIKATIEHLLKSAEVEGHSYLPKSELLERLQLLLEVKIEADRFETAISELKKEEKLIIEADKIYQYFLYQAEKEIAYQIKTLIQSKSKKVKFKNLDRIIEKKEAEAEIKFASEQKEAIKKALNNSISIITGGPGTGKSLIVKTICEIYQDKNKHHKIHLASPTGKAATRLETLTNIKAKTIHRLLKFRGEGFDEHFVLAHPGLLIVDEFSMCDIPLAYHLFSAINANLKVVFVGDTNQLPSVGPGNVLKDMISSGIISTTELKENFRQSDEGVIIPLAKKITEGELPQLNDGPDFVFKKIIDEESALEEIMAVFRRLDRNFNIFNIQVISPIKNGVLGVNNLNKEIRACINPAVSSKPSIGPFRLGDKVMVIKNNYDKEVFNGEFGQVIEVNAKRSLAVKIYESDRVVNFKSDELNYFRHAYACTVHKSQGSEFPFLIMVLSSSHNIMLRRDLLYTGITRTQTKLMLLSDLNTLKRAIDNNIVENRYSSLLEYLKFSNFVSIGDTVKLKDRLNDEVIEYTVVEEDEADVLNSKISFKSPIGKALLKREVGDMFELTTNGNRNVFEILSVDTNSNSY